MCPDSGKYPSFLAAPPAPVAALLARYQEVLDAAAPLAAKHRRALPLAIQELSALLTRERSDLRGDYLREPRFLHAYLRYFLPWNLYRLAVLLPGLAPQLLAGAGQGAEPTVVDLGSGPLTAVQALWIACPELRELPLHVHCLDRAKQVMGLGRDLLDALAAGAGQGDARARDARERNPWRVRLVQGPLVKGLGELRGKVQVLFAVNVLNEVARSGQASLSGLRRTVGDFVRAAFARLARSKEEGREGGRVLIVEPGTRLGGTLVSVAREAALELGGSALAPCTHDLACPALAKESNLWCHFRFPALDAPKWLAQLSHQAGLAKESAALSAVLLSAGGQGGERPEDVARVLSDPLRTPSGPAWYGCSSRGLLLLGRGEEGLADPVQGHAVGYAAHDPEKRDAKSGALAAAIKSSP